MTGILNALIAGVSGAVKDTYFNLVSLLLPGNGTNGKQNRTFLDSSGQNGGAGWTITPNGNATQGTFSPFSQTGWGNRFDGATSTRLTLASGTDFAFGTGAYTMEAWVYLTAYSSAGNVIFDCGSATGSIGLSVTSTGEAQLNKYGTGAIVITAASAVPLNAWTHIAVTRVSTSTNETRIFINGSLSQTGTDNNNWTVTTTPSIGGYGLANYTVNGFISNLSVLKGTAKYTSAFTPATTPLPTNTANQVLLACQANRFIDANTATTAKTLTVNGSPSVTPFSPFAPTSSYSAAAVGGSGYFDGSGDYLSLASDAALAPQASDFTIEAWLYPTAALSTYNSIYETSVTDGLLFGKVTSGYGIRQVGVADLISATAPAINQWVHVAASRSGTTLRLFINGVLSATVTNSTNFPAGTVTLGAGNAGANPFTGYVSNFRFVKGTAVYTATFTPPTAPLTATQSANANGNPSAAITGTATSLLLNFTNAGVVDATAKNVLETVGNAQISTSVSKFGGGSMYFDGSGDWLSSPASPIWIMSGDWTLEGWIYPNSVTGVQVLINTRNLVSGASSPVLYLNGTSLVIDTGAGPVISAGTISLGSSGGWQHIAATRSGNSWRLFINGSQVGSTTTNTTSFTTAYGCTLGSSATNEYYNGYMDDVRVTKYARYTGSTYTVPTAPFPVQ